MKRLYAVLLAMLWLAVPVDAANTGWGQRSDGTGGSCTQINPGDICWYSWDTGNGSTPVLLNKASAVLIENHDGGLTANIESCDDQACANAVTVSAISDSVTQVQSSHFRVTVSGSTSGVIKVTGVTGAAGGAAGIANPLVADLNLDGFMIEDSDIQFDADNDGDVDITLETNSGSVVINGTAQNTLSVLFMDHDNDTNLELAQNSASGLSLDSGSDGVAELILSPTGSLIWEGSENLWETIVTVTDPTADHTFTIENTVGETDAHFAILDNPTTWANGTIPVYDTTMKALVSGGDPPITSSNDPNGVTTATAIGQVYIDDVSGLRWYAGAAENDEWVNPAYIYFKGAFNDTAITAGRYCSAIDSYNNNVQTACGGAQHAGMQYYIPQGMKLTVDSMYIGAEAEVAGAAEGCQIGLAYGPFDTATVTDTAQITYSDASALSVSSDLGISATGDSVYVIDSDTTELPFVVAAPAAGDGVWLSAYIAPPTQAQCESVSGAGEPLACCQADGATAADLCVCTDLSVVGWNIRGIMTPNP